MSPKFLIENSTWQNIGNGFYQWSLYYIFCRLFGAQHVGMTDGPINLGFRTNHFFQKNEFDVREIHDADIFVFSGPILDGRFERDYFSLIRSLHERGKKYAILSAHGDPSTGGGHMVKKMLSNYPPIAFSSRDRPTFNFFGEHIAEERKFDGICAAFLLPFNLPTAGVRSECKYVSYSIYNEAEPKVTWYTDKYGEPNVDSVEVARAPRRGWRFYRHLEWIEATKLPREYKGFRILRPVHGLGYKFSHLNFARPNSYVSFNPLSYASLYAGTHLTVSNRVHACVMTLAYGKPAFYYGNTPRNAIFERIGLSAGGGPLRLDGTVLKKEYDGFLTWLSSVTWG